MCCSVHLTMQPEYASTHRQIQSMLNSWTSLSTTTPVPSQFLLHPLMTLPLFNQLLCQMSSQYERPYGFIRGKLLSLHRSLCNLRHQYLSHYLSKAVSNHFLVLGTYCDTTVSWLIQRLVGDGASIWDSLGKTSDSSIAHKEIGLKHIYLSTK